MARRQTEIKVIVYGPTTEQGREELGRRVAQVHADTVLQQIKRLDWPQEQKEALLDAIIADAKARSGRQQQEQGDAIRWLAG